MIFEEKYFSINIEKISSVVIDEKSGELVINYRQPHHTIQNGLRMRLVFDNNSTQEILEMLHELRRQYVRSASEQKGAGRSYNP